MLFEEGQLVRHSGQAEWGLGRVVRVRGEKIDVFFKERPGVEAVRLLMKKAPLVLAKETTDPWLDNLPQFIEVNGRLQLAEGRLTQGQAVAKFLRLFPKGFKDDKYIGDRRTGERQYKWLAHEEFLRKFGNGRGRANLAKGHFDTLVEDALHIESTTNLLSTFEKARFRDGLRTPGAAKEFFGALFDLLDTEPEQSSFDRYVTAVERIPQPGGRVDTWPVATILPFLAQPDRHMFLKPKVTQEAEARLGFSLLYDSTLNWRTYQQLLKLARLLLGQLHELGAKDFIDVQSFIWVASEYDE